MSPLPVWRTQLRVLMQFLKYLPVQVGWVLLLTFAQVIVAIFAAFFLLAVTPILIGIVVTLPLPIGLGLIFLLYAVVAIGWPLLVQALLWRQADSVLLSSRLEPIKMMELIKGAVFVILMLVGMALIMLIALYAIPGRVSPGASLAISDASKAVPTPQLIVHLGSKPWIWYAVIGAVLVVYMPLLLRLWMLLPTIAIDSDNVRAAWRTVNKSTISKTIPVFASFVFWMIVGLPFLLLSQYFVNQGALGFIESALGVPQPDGPSALTVFLFLALSLVCWAAYIGVSAAIHVGAVRHFIGFRGAAFEEQLTVTGEDINNWAEDSPHANIAVYDPSASEEGGEDRPVAAVLVAPQIGGMVQPVAAPALPVYDPNAVMDAPAPPPLVYDPNQQAPPPVTYDPSTVASSPPVPLPPPPASSHIPVPLADAPVPQPTPSEPPPDMSGVVPNYEHVTPSPLAAPRTDSAGPPLPQPAATTFNEYAPPEPSAAGDDPFAGLMGEPEAAPAVPEPEDDVDPFAGLQ